MFLTTKNPATYIAGFFVKGLCHAVTLGAFPLHAFVVTFYAPHVLSGVAAFLYIKDTQHEPVSSEHIAHMAAEM